MARLRIVIEGEMTPEEMKSYIAAAWGNPLPRDKAEMVVEMDDEDQKAASAALAEMPSDPPEPVVVAAPKATTAGHLSEGQVMELAGAGKLSAIVQAIQDLGVTDTEAITAEVLRIKGAIPGLAKLSEQALVDRIPRVLEMMR